MSQLTITGATDLDLGCDEAKRWEVWYTPAPVVRQWLERLRDEHELEPQRICDPAAGTGVFGAEARKVWPDARIVGVEVRDERVNDAYDHVHRCRFQDLLTTERFDLISTNPPFSPVVDYVEKGRSLLTSIGELSYLLPRGWWQRGAERHAWMTSLSANDLATNAPLREFPVGGAIGFRGGSSADVREYSWFQWDKWPHGTSAIRWPVIPLPMLPGKARRWTSVPGRE